MKSCRDTTKNVRTKVSAFYLSACCHFDFSALVDRHGTALLPVRDGHRRYADGFGQFGLRTETGNCLAERVHAANSKLSVYICQRGVDCGRYRKA